MSNRTLLEQQNELIRFLTNPEVIFGRADFQKVADDSFLGQMSVPHLRLEAELSLQKRFIGITRTLRRTAALLSEEMSSLAPRFVTEYPPKTSIGHLNALSFFHFLVEHWRENPPTPECLPEIAKIEISIDKVRAYRGTLIQAYSPADPIQYRIAPHVEFLDLEFDLRAIFSMKISDVRNLRFVTPKHPNHIAITLAPETAVPRILPIPSELANFFALWRGRTISADMLETISNIEKPTVIFDWMIREGLVEIDPVHQ